MKLTFSPIDTWFFRDGSAFDMGSAALAEVRSVFPPHPSTVAGHCRATLALHNGWDGRGRWSPQLTAVLGDGPEDLGRLRITGPVLLYRGAPVFPMPRHLVGRSAETSSAWRPVAFLRPGRSSFASDLGPTVRFASVQQHADDAASLVPASRKWLKLSGLLRALLGELPIEEDIVDQGELWASEPRVGLERDARSRAAVEGHLYSTSHIRLRAEVGLSVSIDGVPAGWCSPAGSVVPFGGESRLAACAASGPGAELRLGSGNRLSRSVLLVALTPLLLERDGLSGRAELMPGIRVVSACVDRPLRIGGWNSLTREPEPMRNAVAPGTALFCEVEQSEVATERLEAGLLRVGDRTSAGFGLCAVGNGPAWETMT